MILVLYALIPAYVANMAPVLLRKLPWTAPLDFGLSLNGERILGQNKTWRGLIGGTIIGTAAAIIISNIYWPFSFSPIAWGLLASSGALIGDSVKSFFKRRIKIKSGKSWVPFDQIDFTVGALAFGSFVWFPGWLDSALAIMISALAHIIVNHIAFYTGVREEKW